MDERKRRSAELERREGTEYLKLVLQALQRDGMPRLPGARRLGGNRFSSGWGGRRGAIARQAKA
jgi:hypothetical protein